MHADRTWVSSYEIDPFSVPDEEKSGLLAEWSARLLAADGVAHVDASLLTVHENKFYADTAGTVTTQQRVRLHPQLTAVAVDASSGEFDSMRTIAPPVGRGWEYLTGTGWDWDAELARIPEHLAEKMRAPSVEAGLVRPGRRPVQPVADHPRVDRPRHRAGPRARLRSGVRGHLVRHLRPARQARVRLRRS